MDDNFKDTADGVARARDLLDFFLHARFGGGIDATEQDLVLGANRLNLFPRGCSVEFDAAHANHMAGNFNAKRPQHQLGEGSRGDAAGGLASRGALKHIASVGEVVFQSAGQVGVTGTRRGNRLVLGCVARRNGQLFFPVLPVAVHDLDRDRRADGVAVPHPGEHMGLVGFNLHPAATAVALLPPPQLAVHEIEIDGDTGWKAGDKGDERLAVGLAGGGETDHIDLIVTETAFVGGQEAVVAQDNRTGAFMKSERPGLLQRLNRSLLCNRASLLSCRKTLTNRSRALAPATLRTTVRVFFDCFLASQAAFLPNPNASFFKRDCSGSSPVVTGQLQAIAQQCQGPSCSGDET